MSLEGKQAPGFRLEGSDGQSHAIEDFRGKYLVLFFYPKDNTSGCTSEAIGFRDLHQDFTDLDVTVVGCSRDTLKAHAKFIADHNLPFTLLSDPETTTMAAYSAFGEKVQYGKTTMGTIRSTVVISPEGNVVKHWAKIPKASEHPAKVLEYLKATQGR